MNVVLNLVLNDEWILNFSYVQTQFPVKLFWYQLLTALQKSLKSILIFVMQTNLHVPCTSGKYWVSQSSCISYQNLE